jgi:hypothetical protein
LRRRPMRMMKLRSSAMAVSEKIVAAAAAGEARSKQPRRMVKMVENQAARSRVCVEGELYPK